MPSIEALGGAVDGEPLAPLTTLGVGGPARWLLRARTVEDVDRAHRWSRSNGAPLFVLGGGSNLVIADAGFDGLVVHVDVRGREHAREGTDTLLTAGAGESWDETVADCVARGLAGLECLSGIPGTVGGTPIQNVGAYGQEVANCIDHLTAFDRENGALCTLTGRDCGFSYRTSRFKQTDGGRFVICTVTFRLRVARPTTTYPDITEQLSREGVSAPDVEHVRNAVLAVRRRKGMVIDPGDPDTRSVGSFFMNPVVTAIGRDRVAAVAGAQPPAFPADGGRVKLPAAWLIERAGFRRGDTDGNVGISTKHTLALVNRGGATARDVLRFAARIKRGVVDRFGISLRPEPVFVGFGHNHDLEFLTHVQSPD
ncbi:MAG TPA: UDP-N-acetylmuramate dehydrogenase [Vicinamibacterales bacterium]|nr:UDP-N-acetylmuramate dehydrogenase [Vicinamibacterales bacterium]